jgi:hypothetical protein
MSGRPDIIGSIGRASLFEEVRRRGHLNAVALLEQLSEDAIANPAGLLS